MVAAAIRGMLALSLGVTLVGCAADSESNDSAENPLLEAWSTPFETPPFDQIETGHFEPAFETAMARHLEP